MNVIVYNFNVRCSKTLKRDFNTISTLIFQMKWKGIRINIQRIWERNSIPLMQLALLIREVPSTTLWWKIDREITFLFMKHHTRRSLEMNKELMPEGGRTLQITWKGTQIDLVACKGIKMSIFSRRDRQRKSILEEILTLSMRLTTRNMKKLVPAMLEGMKIEDLTDKMWMLICFKKTTTTLI
jgi:hypothetical protein